MPLSQAPVQQSINQGGVIGDIWVRWISLLVKQVNTVELPIYTVASLPASVTGAMVYVSNESGGAVPAFYDGTNWRRVTDRAIVT